MNIKAAFLHNVTDALASVGVIITGTLILLFGWVWTDAAMTLIISGYVLWQGITQIPKVIHLLMEGTPEGIEVEEVVVAMKLENGVADVHHVHLWQLDEHRNALEAHVVLSEGVDMDDLKHQLKNILHDRYESEHSTLEFENKNCMDSSEF